MQTQMGWKPYNLFGREAFVPNRTITDREMAQIRAHIQEPTINNCVCSATWTFPPDYHNDLWVTAWETCGTYTAHGFAPCVIKASNLNCTFSIHKSGRVNITGNSSLGNVLLSTEKCRRYIKKQTSASVQQTNMSMSNMHGILYMRRNIDKEAIAQYTAWMKFDPKVIKHVKIQPGDKGLTFLVYTSGRVVVTGVSTKEAIDKAANEIVGFLAYFLVGPLHDQAEQEKEWMWDDDE